MEITSLLEVQRHLPLPRWRTEANPVGKKEKLQQKEQTPQCELPMMALLEEFTFLAGSPLEHSWHSCFRSRHFGWLEGLREGEEPDSRYLGILAGWELLWLWDHEGNATLAPQSRHRPHPLPA